jgi:hypothetical protein
MRCNLGTGSSVTPALQVTHIESLLEKLALAVLRGSSLQEQEGYHMPVIFCNLGCGNVAIINGKGFEAMWCTFEVKELILLTAR